MDDWRLTNQLDYLYRKRLKRADFLDFPEKDHEHCSFCWDKFGHSVGAIRYGYCTDDTYHWICDKCFQDFKDLFAWVVDI